MKKILSSILLSFLLANIVSASQLKDAFSVIYSRKSIRNFTGEPVQKSDLEEIVRAGMAAPTAANRQPWSFVIVTERKKLDELASHLPYAKMLSKAGAAIIVCASPQKALNESTEFAVIDSSLAGENILLAIEALGLGGVWTAAYPASERMAAVREVLNIPKDIIPLNVIPVGHPTGEDKPKNKFKKENIHWETW